MKISFPYYARHKIELISLEKVMRLKIENKTLKKRIDATVVASVPAPTNNYTAKMVAKPQWRRWRMKLRSFRPNFKKKNAATAKLVSDKDTLESYTKKTLSKFWRNVSGCIAGVQSKSMTKLKRWRCAVPQKYQTRRRKRGYCLLLYTSLGWRWCSKSWSMGNRRVCNVSE